VADVAVGLAVESERLFEKWAKGKSLFESLAVGTIAAFAQALILPLAPIAMMNDALIALADLAGIEIDKSFRTASASLDKFVQGGGALEFGEMAVSAIENSDAYHKLGDAVDGVAETGAQFISTQERAIKATKAHTAATKENKGAAEEWARSTRLANEAIEQGIQRLQDAVSRRVDGIHAVEAAQKVLDQVNGVAAKKVDIVNAAMTDLIESYADGKIEIEQYTEAWNKLVEAQNAATVADQAATKKLANQSLQTGLDAAKGFTQSFASMLDTAYGATYNAAANAAQEAAAQVSELQSQIDGLGMDTVNAASLSGQALVDAYKSGKVAAQDLSEAQKKALQSQLQAEEDTAAKQVELQKATALKAWKSQQAAAIASATIQAILGVIGALTMLPWTPLNIVNAALVGAAGGAEIAKIAASPPPKFHTGTLYASEAGGLAPGEFAATLQRGEIVIDKQTASKPGVRESVAAMAGGGGGIKATHPDDVAEGLDRSSVPGLLSALLTEIRRGNSRSTPSTTTRPGHRPSYGY
jgi:hypothetical protein